MGPYFQRDSSYHIEGIHESLMKAAASPQSRRDRRERSGHICQ